MADKFSRRDLPERGLDPEFLEELLPLCRAFNETLPADPPIPPSDGPGAHLREWRRLTDPQNF
jgi:hypothetical protein